MWFEGVPRSLSSVCAQRVTQEVKDRMWGPCCARLLLCGMGCLPFDLRLVRCWASRSLLDENRDLLPDCAPTLHIPTVTSSFYPSLISATYSALAFMIIIVKRGLAETNMVDKEMRCVFQLFRWPPVSHFVLENSKILVEEDGN